MSVKVGISGFGRIGRCTLRTSLLQPEIEVTAINNRSTGPIMADLLKFDTVHGTWDHDVSYDSETDALIIDGHRIKVTSHTDPGDIPWKKLGVDIVVESTGKFKDRPSASKHLAGGAKRVIISAPGKIRIRRLSWGSMKKPMILRRIILSPMVLVRRTA